MLPVKSLFNNNIAQSKYIQQILIFALIVLFPQIILAGNPQTDGIAWVPLIMTLLGGLALFLYGMEKMSDGMKKAAGSRMRNILSALTNNRVIAMIVGAFVTMVIQSSSATTVMLVSFVQAELMAFVQAMGVILGADIGTTVTAQLIAFKLTDYALLMIAVGFALTMFAKNDSQKHFGEALLGFGILFFGMKLMSDAMKPLRTFQPFIDMLRGLENPLLGLLVGTIFTALIQSSSAFTGIVIVLAQQGLLTLDAGIPLIFGANVGTCVTAGLASIGTKREAKRVALAHVVFKIAGILIFIFWIPAFADFIRWLSPVAQGTGVDKLAAETPRQIANAHTVFNVGLAFIFLPFTTIFANIIMKILPEKEKEKGIEPVVWHLDYKKISAPAMAMDLARAEISRMAKILGRMLQAIILPFVSSAPTQDKIYPHLSVIEGIQMRENKIDFLEEKIYEYQIEISRQELGKDMAHEVFVMISIVKDMESIGDIIDKNVIPLIAKKRALGTDFSPEGKEELKTYHTKACKQISRLKEALAERDAKKAVKIMKKEEEYLDLESHYRIKHLERVRQARTESVATHEVHMELMDLLKQISVYTANIAKDITSLKENGEEE
ncbi:Na/Pi cotransporter family protein [candidate division KSB1 bacterium]|nr:Na/Pi cotransporter family protein [candidate division KSB1 bacterium]MBL7094927.1 Na/Pi cotransporter family protein [candidate division KSB1 bacterium]